MENVLDCGNDFVTPVVDTSEYKYIYDAREIKRYGFVNTTPLLDLESYFAPHSTKQDYAFNGSLPRADFSVVLKINNWDKYLTKLGYWDHQLIYFLRYGFPLDVVTGIVPSTKVNNHPTAHNFPQHVKKYLSKEVALGAIIGPFKQPPISGLHCSPLLTREKANSVNRRVIVDMSWPHGASINDSVYKNICTKYI